MLDDAAARAREDALTRKNTLVIQESIVWKKSTRGKDSDFPDTFLESAETTGEGHLPAVDIQGKLEGYDAWARQGFNGRQQIRITFKCLGIGIPGVHVIPRVAGTELQSKSAGHIFPSRSVTLRFSSTHWEPVPWELDMWARGADNSLILYAIRG